MATIKSEYYRFNGVSWDTHYFKTTLDMVDGLQGVLDGKAALPLASLRNFVDGTTINTNIDYSQTSGAPFLLRIYGNTYTRQIPTETVIQGYIYNDTIINYSGYSVGSPITGLVALNVGGKLTFWFPRQGYWEGYFAEVFDVGGAGGKVNLVTSILDTTKPVGTKEVSFSNIVNVVLTDDSRLTNARPASDVYAWAKAANKPSYTWSEIGSKPAWIGSTKPDYAWNEILAKPSVIIEGDARLANDRPASDVYPWAKEPFKPSYTWSDINNKPGWIGPNKPSYSWNEITSKPTVIVNTATDTSFEALIQKNYVILESAADTFTLSDEGIPSLYCGPNRDGLFEVYGSISSTRNIRAMGDISINGRSVQKQSIPVNISSSVTLNSSHLDTMIVCRNASAMTLTLPVQTSLGTPPHGTEIHFFQYGAGKTTIGYEYGVTIISKGSKRAIDGQYAAATLKLIDNNVWILVGALQS